MISGRLQACESRRVQVEPVVINTNRPRAGRRFEPSHELELEGDAVYAARTLPGAHRGVLVLKEMAGPFGVPDLLAAVGPANLLVQRHGLLVPSLLNQADAGIVSAAAVNAARSPETLANRLSWPSETVRRRLPELVRSGALVRVGIDTYVRPRQLIPVARMYAIETKIRDWRRALRQSRAYSVWCDSYVIVMDSLGDISLSAAVDTIAADGGGLMVAGRWVLRPKLRGLNPAQRLWGSEHLVAATQDQISTGAQ